MAVEICRCKHGRTEHLIGSRHCQRDDCYCSTYRQSAPWEMAQDRAYELWDQYKRSTGRDPVADGMCLLMRSSTWIAIQDQTIAARVASNPATGTLFGGGGESRHDDTLFGLPVIITSDRQLSEGEVRAVLTGIGSPPSD